MRANDASVVALVEQTLEPFQRSDNGPVCCIVRPKFEQAQQLRQHASIVTAIGGTQHGVDSLLIGTASLVLADQRRKYRLVGNRKDDFAHRSVRRIDCRLGDPSQQALLAVHFLNVPGDRGDDLAFCLRRHFVNGLEQEIDDRINDFALAAGKKDGVKAKAARLRMPPNFPRGFLADTAVQPLYDSGVRSRNQGSRKTQ